MVCHPLTHHILSYAPGKSLSLDQFQKKYEGSVFDEFLVSETVEGTMVNLFYHEGSKSWEIATRGSVGGNYWYNRTQYVEKTGLPKEPVSAESQPVSAPKEPVSAPKEPYQKTFRQMFIEALHGDPNLDLSDIPGMAYLDKTLSYSFVLQHPDNHMVYTITSPSATLVAIYELHNSDDAGNECMFFDDEETKTCRWTSLPRVRYVGPQETDVWNNVQGCLACNTLHIYPEISSYEEFDQLTKHFDQPNQKPKRASLGLNIANETRSVYKPMGWMLTHAITGDRVSIENPHYVRLRNLRGNNPNLQYHYLSLYRIGKVTEFLEWFPMYKSQFYEFYTNYHTFITDVHNAYVSYYVLKEARAIPKKYFIHAAKIHHDVFLPSLTNGNNRKTITHRVVREYFDAFTPGKMLYYLRYEETDKTVESSNAVSVSAELA
jgi:hypothetical protein